MHFWNCKTCAISSGLREKLWMAAVAEIRYEYQFTVAKIERWLFLCAGKVFQPGISEIQPAWWYFYWAVQYWSASPGKQGMYRNSGELSASGRRLPGEDGEHAVFARGSLTYSTFFYSNMLVTFIAMGRELQYNSHFFPPEDPLILIRIIVQPTFKLLYFCT